MKRLLLAAILVSAAAVAQPPPANLVINQSNVQGGTPADCLIVNANRRLGQSPCTAGGAVPTGPAGGDLSGTYPNPTVHQVNGAAVPLSAGALGTDGNGGLIAVAPGGVTPGYPGNMVVAGCGVEYVTGLTFVVGECIYTIGGTQYTISTPTTITLTAADNSNPRIDVIYVDDSSVANKLTGQAQSNPSQPTVDYSTQLPLNFVLVPAMSSTPGGIALTSIYDENTEWTSTCSTHLNCASTTNPFRGTKTIEATLAVLGNTVTLVKPAAGTVDLSTQNTLILYIRSKGAWPSGNGTGANGLRTLSLFWLSGSTQVGLQVVIKDGAFGFISSNSTTYQQIAIPINLFSTGSNTVTTLKAQVTGNGGTSSFGWYIDAVTLQSGQAPITLPTTLMKFQGNWNTTSNYNPNDVVVSGGKGYVALSANTNVVVTTAATWAPLAPSGTVTSIATSTPITGGTITSTGTIACATCVTSSSPGAGIAHFAGSTQAVTSSAIVNADITNSTIDLTTKVTGILPSANGGTANGFTKFSGPTTSEKTFTLPNASSTLTITIASGAKALATGAISSAACTSAQTDTANGTATTDAIIATFNGDPTGVTGYVPLTTGMLTIIPYPTADTVNFKVCNNTAGSITPGAITINWRVVR